MFLTAIIFPLLFLNKPNKVRFILYFSSPLIIVQPISIGMKYFNLLTLLVTLCIFEPETVAAHNTYVKDSTANFAVNPQPEAIPGDPYTEIAQDETFNLQEKSALELKNRRVAGVISIIILFIFSTYIIIRKNFRVIRDFTKNKEELAPFSLARTQMVFWTLLIIASFFIVWMATGNLITITPQVLVLLGISAGTSVSAQLIDINDSNNEKIERHQETNSSQSFLLNILSDKNGVSVHRFQNVAFTIVIGSYFLFEVIQNHKIPELDSSLMILMGISSGTYLALKSSENKA